MMQKSETLKQQIADARADAVVSCLEELSERVVKALLSQAVAQEPRGEQRVLDIVSREISYLYQIRRRL